MYLPIDASKARVREAEHARNNRLAIVKALADGEISRRDLFKWGLFTTTGAIALKHGLSVYAPSAYGQVPTGTPRSPLFGAVKFSEAMHRPLVQTPIRLAANAAGDAVWQDAALNREPNAKKFSWHDQFSANPGDTRYVNPVTGKGPFEGRPPGEFFAHQRWTATGADSDLFPKVGYLMSIGQCEAATRFNARFAEQNANAIWSFGTRLPGHVGNRAGSRLGYGAPCLFKFRYGEPAVTRIYNDLPELRSSNGGFGRNEISTHFHNAHHGAESDGASNAYHFPGTFYDYHWSLALARRDLRSVRPPTTWTTCARPPARPTAAACSWSRATSASCRAACGCTTTASSLRRRMCTRACSPSSTSIAAPIAATSAISATASTCACRAGG